MKCISCGEEIDEECGYHTEKGIICETCYDDDLAEPIASFRIYTKKGDITGCVGHYNYIYSAVDDADDDIDEDIGEDLCVFIQENIEFVHTDPWRGYYDIKKSPNSNWLKIDEDTILHGSEDAEELRKHAADLVAYLIQLNIATAEIFTITSNIFASNWYLYAYKPDLDSLKTLLIQQKVIANRLKYRDLDRFIATAITGKSEDFDEDDKLLVKVVKELFKKSEEEIEKLTVDDLIHLLKNID